MAKVVELVKEDEDALLWHSIIGLVAWTDPHNLGSRFLNHAVGPDRCDPLYFDWEVLNGDKWEINTNQWDEFCKAASTDYQAIKP